MWYDIYVVRRQRVNLLTSNAATCPVAYKVSIAGFSFLYIHSFLNVDTGPAVVPRITCL